MNKTNIKTRTYSAGFENFMIDISETEKNYDAFIYRENNGLKIYIFGVLKENTTLKEYKGMIENTLIDYMYYYDKELTEIEEMHNNLLNDND